MLGRGQQVIKNRKDKRLFLADDVMILKSLSRVDKAQSLFNRYHAFQGGVRGDPEHPRHVGFGNKARRNDPG